MASNSATRFEEEDDTWIPLVQSEETQQGDPGLAGVSYGGSTNTARRTSPAGSQIPPASRKSTSNSSSKNNKPNDLQSIQRRLETRVAVQTNLVNHPVDLFWRRFLLNFVREIWALEIRIRLGLLLLISGLCIRCFLYSIWYILYPRVAILSVILIGSIVYLDPFDVQRQLRGIANVIISPDKAFQAMEQLDLSQLRVLSFCLFMVPTMLEIRTLSFLSQIKAESGWTMYNLGIGGILLAAMLSLHNLKGMKPRECSYQGMLILYGSALIVTIYSWDIRRIPVLAAPFLTATGTLLLTYQDDDMEWISRIVRHALRLTLRDVLSSVGERVAEDEMLQLAILRWICDFWANNQEKSEPPPTSHPTPSGTNTRPQEEATSSPSSSPSQSTQRPSGTAADSGVIPNDVVPSSAPSQEDYHLREIQWQELLPMLNIEINHMEAEVEALQSENTPNEGSSDNSTNRRQTGQTGRTNRPAQNQPDMQSFEGLKSMLLSLNVDDRAKPAVSAYRRAVESFPPEKRRALAISVIRRCPALITMTLQIFFSGPRTIFTSVVILFPFIVMEYLRIMSWIESCRRVATVCGFVQTEPQGIEDDNQSSWGIPEDLKNVDTMAILLCGDSSTLRPPTLLVVWQNIVGSVNALEVGLTAARCAETTVVAVDFAGNVMDLVQFGLEVSQRGLLHGLMVMAKEAISIHTSGVDLNDLHNVEDESARYTRAAMRAVHSGHRVARNVQLLSEDQHIGSIVQPMLMTLDILTGHGWLWGRDIGREDPSASADSNMSANEKNGASSDPHETTMNTESEAPATQDDADDTAMEVPELSWEPSLRPTEAIPKEEDRFDSTPSLSSSQDDLSEVMEMVSKAYEHGLIDTEEKNDFYEKLSMLQQSELLDVSVVSGIKRTLLIILENGCTLPVHDDTFASAGVDDAVAVSSSESEQNIHIEDDFPNNTQGEPGLTNDTENERYHRQSPVGDDPDFIPLDTTSENINCASQESRTEESSSDDHNGAFVKLGVAALGVVAGGLLLSMRGRNENNDNGNSANQTTTEEGYERNESSTVEIEELPDDDREDDWVSVAQ